MKVQAVSRSKAWSWLCLLPQQVVDWLEKCYTILLVYRTNVTPLLTDLLIIG